ncbi:MAG: hypothetical protein ACFCU9_03470, partial [Cyanophyceae cyanobacterium]
MTQRRYTHLSATATLVVFALLTGCGSSGSGSLVTLDPVVVDDEQPITAVLPDSVSLSTSNVIVTVPADLITVDATTFNRFIEVGGYIPGDHFNISDLLLPTLLGTNYPNSTGDRLT